MNEPGWIVSLSQLRPDEPREFVHRTPGGTLVRCELQEATTSFFKARVLSPFEATFSGGPLPLFVIGITGYCFVRDGRATPHLIGALQRGMESAVNEFQRHQQAVEHFEKNRESLEPIIVEAHRTAAGVCFEVEALVDRLQTLGEALAREMREKRQELRRAFLARQIDQSAYQAKRKVLRKTGPATEAAQNILAEAAQLQGRYKSLIGLLRQHFEDFNGQAGLRLDEATGFLGLEGLPIPANQFQDPVQRLKNLSTDVHLLLMAFP